MLKNGIYNALTGVTHGILALVTLPLLIRMLGIVEYGLWAYISAIVMLVVYAEPSLTTATTVFMSRDIANKNTDAVMQTFVITHSAMVIFATLSSWCIFFSAHTITAYIPNLTESQYVEASKAVQLSAIVIWIRLLIQIFTGVEQAFNQYKLLNSIAIVYAFVHHISPLVMAFWKPNTIYMMMAWAVTSLGILIIHLIVTVKLIGYKNFKLTWNWQKSKMIFYYALTTWPASLSTVIFTRFDRIIVGAVAGTAVLGTYSVITSITTQISSITGLVAQPIMPVLSSLLSKAEIDSTLVWRRIRQANIINLVLCVLMGTGLVVFASLIMHVINPKSTTTDILAFQLACVIYAILATNVVSYYILLAFRITNFNSIITILSSTLSLLLIAVLSARLSIVGAVLGNSGFILTLFIIPFSVNQVSKVLAASSQYVSRSFVAT